MSISKSTSFRSCLLIAAQGTCFGFSAACIGVNPTFIDCDLISGTDSIKPYEAGEPCHESEPTSTTGFHSNTDSESHPTSDLESTTSSESTTDVETTTESETMTSSDSQTGTDTGRFGELLIDFDDWTSAPDYFNESPGPVRNEYAASGVLFSGRSMTDGAGVISNETWTAEGGSLPNYLALNCGRTYQSGGVPCGDIAITFDKLATKVEFLTGTDYVGLTLTATARDANGMMVMQQNCPTGQILQPCSLQGAEIMEVTLVMEPESWYVVDDLRVVF